MAEDKPTPNSDPNRGRVTLVISSLSTGGAERALVNLANWLVASGWKVTIVTIDAKPSSYALDHRVMRTSLDMLDPHDSTQRTIAYKVGRNVERLQLLRRTILDSDPQVIVSFVDRTNVRVLIAMLGCAIPVIVTEQIDPAAYESQVGVIWRLMRRAIYGKAATIVLLTQASRSYFPDEWQSQIRVIPNPIIVPSDISIRDSVPIAPETRTLLAMGRLVDQKGFDILLTAFARIARDFPNWRLVILGEGALRESLQRQARQLGIAELVELRGNVSDPFPVLRAGDCFVLSSRYEGFPNALLEAMACGLPAIAFDCPTGPREIIRPGIDGLLVPPENVEMLGDALAFVMSQDAVRHRYALEAPNVLERFGANRVLGEWERLIAGVMQPNKERA